MDKCKIINFQAENYKILKAVEITPEGHVILSGKNEQGKSSILDAIQETLTAGTGPAALKDHKAVQPLREGQEKGFIKVDLGDFIVTRSYTENNSYLKVENKDGFKAGSPAKLLANVVGRISFDPVAFSRLSGPEQRKTIKDMDPGLDFSVQDAEHKKLYEERTIHNRSVSNLLGEHEGLKKQIEDMNLDMIPAEEISVVELSQKKDVVKDSIVELETEKKSLLMEHSNQTQKAEDLRTNMAQWNGEIVDLHEQIKTRELAIREADKELKDLDLTGPNVGAIDDKIKQFEFKAEQANQLMNTSETINKAVRLEAQLEKVKAAGKEERDKIVDIEKKMEAINKQKEAALKESKLPVKGLALADSGILFEGKPFQDLADSRRLRISCQVAMAQNPKLCVFFVRDGSLLDEDSRKEVFALAQEKGFDVWMEITDSSEKMGIVIQDGEIKTINKEEPVAATEPGKS